MTAETKEGTKLSVVGFIGRFAVTHTVVYFIAGMIFTALMNYEELFGTAEYGFMRPFDHPLVIVGPSLQIFRGALLALAFLPFRKVIIGSKRGWLYIFVPIFILMHVGADATDPGKIESFIYEADLGNGLFEYEYDHLIIGSFDGDVNINSDEVKSFKWVLSDDLIQDVKNTPDKFTEWFKIILKNYAFKQMDLS